MLCADLERVLSHFFNRSEYGYREGPNIVVQGDRFPESIFCHAYLVEDGVKIVGKKTAILVEAGVCAGRGGTGRLNHLLQWYSFVVLVASVLGRPPTYCL